MKKIIITAISAIAVIASVIGCQIYDSQTNKPLASGMNSAAEGNAIVKWDQFATEFNKACNDYLDNSSDDNLKKIAEKYLSFEKFYAVAWKNVKSYNSSAVTKIDTYNYEKVKECYIENFMKPGKPYDLYVRIYAFNDKYTKRLKEDKTAELDKVKGKTKRTGDEKKATDLENKEKIDDLKQSIEDEYTVEPEKYPYVDMDVTTDAEAKATVSLKSLYETEYQLKWDYNSKK